jgi:hypothetical protein
MAAVPQVITLTWRDKEVRVTPSHDLFMQIEERVPFGRLSTLFSASDGADQSGVPMSHVSWVVFCVLRQGGERIDSPMEVHRAVFAGEVGWGSIIGQLMAAYYGALPAKPPNPKKSKAAPKRNSRR